MFSFLEDQVRLRFYELFDESVSVVLNLLQHMLILLGLSWFCYWLLRNFKLLDESIFLLHLLGITYQLGHLRCGISLQLHISKLYFVWFLIRKQLLVIELARLETISTSICKRSSCCSCSFTSTILWTNPKTMYVLMSKILGSNRNKHKKIMTPIHYSKLKNLNPKWLQLICMK